MLSLPCLWLPSKDIPQQSASAVGAPKVLNFVSKNFRDVNASEELLSLFPSGHIQERENTVLEQFLMQNAVL